jgi:hypothetical protein
MLPVNFSGMTGRELAFILKLHFQKLCDHKKVLVIEKYIIYIYILHCSIAMRTHFGQISRPSLLVIMHYGYHAIEKRTQAKGAWEKKPATDEVYLTR